MKMITPKDFIKNNPLALKYFDAIENPLVVIGGNSHRHSRLCISERFERLNGKYWNVECLGFNHFAGR